MNILFVNDFPFNPVGGGVERVTDILTKEFIKRGHAVYYIYGKLTHHRCYLLDYEFPAKIFQLPNYGMFNDEENLAFYQQIQKKLEIDIVINQRGLSGAFNGMLPVTSSKLISVIHSVPDGDVIAYLNRIMCTAAPPFVFIKRVLKQLFPSFLSMYWKKKALKDLKMKYEELIHFSDAIVTLSHGDMDKFNSLICRPQNPKVLSISNPNTFRQVLNQSINKKKIVLYVGRLWKEDKEPLRLLEIWKKLYLANPDWRLVIVGEGKEKTTMMNYAEKKRLRNVFFEGSQTDVAKYYSEASFICLTSNFEGWGMALTEGMQYGCIPFSFNSYGAASEIIDDGINGCLIPAYDLKRYALRLQELMLDEDKRLTMSKASIEKVRQFSVESIVDRWEKLFNSFM